MVLFCTFLLKTEYINSVFCSAPVFSAPDSTAHVGRMGLGDNPTRNIVHSSHHQVYMVWSLDRFSDILFTMIDM